MTSGAVGGTLAGVRRPLAALLIPVTGLAVGCASCEPSEASPDPTAPASRPAEERWQRVESQIQGRFAGVQQIRTDAVRDLLAAGDATLVDVRHADEFAVSHLPGALHVDGEAEIEAIRAAIPLDRPVVVYCSVGWRSSAFAQRLTAAGYTDVRNYLGSIFEWANGGGELVDGTGAATDHVHPFNSDWGALLRPELRAPLDAR